MTLTRQERFFVYFLLAALVVGGILNIYRKRALQARAEDPSALSFLTQFHEAFEAVKKGESMLTRGESVGEEEGENLFRIDLNTATEEDLLRLPRVGPVTARRIIQLRQRIGAFHAVEQLLEVKGIGEKTLEEIRPFVYVGREQDKP